MSDKASYTVTGDKITKMENGVVEEVNIPQPVTSNGWSPVEHFDAELFPDHQDFLVWLVTPNGDGFCCVAQYAPVEMDKHIEGYENLPHHITGEWRHTDEWKDLEPVAYRAMPDGPDLDGLKRIVEVHPKLAA